MDLKHLLENEYFIASQLLPTDRFIKFCNERGINISRELLVQLEKFNLFHPVARVSLPTYKNKIEYLEDGKRYKDLGILKDGETWEGDIIKEYYQFWFEKPLVQEWYKANLIWDPILKPFESWNSFKDSDGREIVRSYYSQFQIFTLGNLIHILSKPIPVGLLLNGEGKDIYNTIQPYLEWTKHEINSFKNRPNLKKEIPTICQAISNRYYPSTQTDRR